MNKPEIILVGGGHCKSCIDVIESQNKYSIKGIIDFPELLDTLIEMSSSRLSEIVGTKKFKFVQSLLRSIVKA